MAASVIVKDPEILDGMLVFHGTRVPVKNLIDYFATGETIDAFLDDFPTVKREQVIRFGSCVKSVKSDNLRNKLRRNMLQVASKLADGDVAKEILLVNTFEWSQEIADICPHPFNCIAVNLAKAIAILVAGILFSAMTNGISIALDAVVALIFIGVDQRIFAGESLNMLTEGKPFGIIGHSQTYLPTLSSHRSQNRWAINRIDLATHMMPTARVIYQLQALQDMLN